MKLTKKEKRIIEVALDNLLKGDYCKNTKEEIEEVKYKIKRNRF